LVLNAVVTAEGLSVGAAVGVVVGVGIALAVPAFSIAPAVVGLIGAVAGLLILRGTGTKSSETRGFELVLDHADERRHRWERDQKSVVLIATAAMIAGQAVGSAPNGDDLVARFGQLVPDLPKDAIAAIVNDVIVAKPGIAALREFAGQTDFPQPIRMGAVEEARRMLSNVSVQASVRQRTLAELESVLWRPVRPGDRDRSKSSLRDAGV
jgi:hypothetical protein